MWSVLFLLHVGLSGVGFGVDGPLFDTTYRH